jgi:MFS family permease
LLAPRIGYRTTAVIGFALTAAGLFGMRLWSIDPSEGALWIALAIAGVGFTLPDAPICATVIDAVEPGRRASATAMLQVLQTTGMVVGMALLASQGLGRFDQRAADLFQATAIEADPEQYRAIIHQTFDETFLVAGCVMVLAAMLSLLLGSSRTPPRQQDGG